MKDQKTFPYCGIIFIHPYINLLFSNLDLLENNQFKNEAAQIKAIQLLYFAATSNTDSPPQSDLVILKRFVDLPSNHSVSFPNNLTATNEKECLFLLNSFIANWAALKNCTIEILQNHFLSKRGTILETSETFEISLEKNPLDLLLNTIPFSCSIVKLPRLNHVITTRISE